jgi:photosystem II stability/assembly factor-like uncharacterized protein
MMEFAAIVRIFSLGAVRCGVAAIAVGGLVASAIAASPASAAGQQGQASAFVDPLDHPALERTNIDRRPFLAVAAAGARLVAVGSRGLIAFSDDGGRAWHQAKVPVESDLLAVQFPSARRGWAVGHDGVILESEDGGATWSRQMDGRVAAKTFTQYYQGLEEKADASASAALATVTQNYKAGPVLPFLDVCFEDDNTGYAVGSFGTIATTKDGGKTWTPWLHAIDNPQQLNLNAVRDIGGNVLLAAEKGQIFRLNRVTRRFDAMSTGYSGSFLAIVGSEKAIVAFGLRGTAFRSSDGGNSWAQVQVPGSAGVTAGAMIPGGAGFLLVNGAGQLVVGNAEATEFHLAKAALPMPLTGVVVLADGTAVVTGLAGVVKTPLPN